MNLWWKCPNCGDKVDYANQLELVFDDENGEAEFDPEIGMWLHTIFCNCGALWTTGISKMEVVDLDNYKMKLIEGEVKE